MHNFHCPICEAKIEVSDSAKAGDRITCMNCYTQLALYKIKKKHIIGCVSCKETVFNPQNCIDCGRRREKKKLLEEGRL